MVFAKGSQQHFVEQTKLRSGLTWAEYRKRLGIANHVHYRYEDCSVPLRVFRRALKVTKISPIEARGFHHRVVKDRGKTVLRIRRNTNAAELFGICLGDGHLSRYYLAIFGDKSRDTDYLLHHVRPLMRKVLTLVPKMKMNRPSENFLILNSAAASRSLHKLGLPYGNKIRNGARIPEWVFRRKLLLKACVRGLFDTDGCVYGFKRKPPARGSKAIISFEFGRGSLISSSVHRALCYLGYRPRMIPHRNECRLGMNKDIVRFMSEIRPANAKHRENFARWHGPVV